MLVRHILFKIRFGDAFHSIRSSVLLPSAGIRRRKAPSRMKNKFFAMLALVGVCFVFTGCNAVQGYSVRSYQGPLPMNDYQYLNQDSYGTPMAGR